MANVAPSVTQIRSQVAALRKRHPDACAFGIHTPAPWDGPRTLLIGNETLTLHHCTSSLDVRERLMSSPLGGPPVVILTPLTDAELEADVRARFVRGRLLTIKTWEVVRDAFQLRDIDPRLIAETWMADALLDLRSSRPERVVPSGFLDADTAWDMVAELLGLPTGRADVLELLRWAEAGGTGRLTASPEALREGVRRRLEETAGAAVEPLFACLAGSAANDAVPLGLVCGVVFAEDVGPDDRITVSKAAVRLERFCADRPVAPRAGRAWARASETLVEDALNAGGLESARAWLQRADVLLGEVEADGCAFLGRYSLHGFEQRLARLAAALSNTLDGGKAEPLGEALAALRAHGLARAFATRLSRVEMAARLVRWLRSWKDQEAAPGSFIAAAQQYAASGGFVDWVRSTLEAGDGSQPLSEAYGRLLEQVAQVRERENERFGRLLAEWVAAAASPGDALPIESVLSRVVAPLAEQVPVLLLVLDGMSVPVFRELAEDLGREGWVDLVPEGASDLGPVIAALPTVTEVSRASLLSGRLVSGGANVENEAFAGHELLRQRTGSKKPPILFHKGDLMEAGELGLATAVREELEDPGRRVVGVVVNAVDDHLAKGDQLRPAWSVESIRPLRGLLHASARAGRVVVITSDHGHVLERGAELRSYRDAERWRADDGSPAGGEVVLTGPRVVLPPSKRLIAPWGERLRYGQKKNGYHGGASPQEVVVPIGVFSIGVQAKGWREVGPRLPGWWSDQASPAPTAPVAPRPKPRQPKAQKVLFVDAEASANAGWIDLLLASPTWKNQAQAAGRLQVDLARVRAALAALDERGGRMTRSALAHRLELPSVRVNGFVAALRRVLNVDGYDVLEVDEASDTLVINRELLRKQFELP